MQLNPVTESVEDEDEVLTALSDELGGFVEYVGGPEYGHVLLSPLENLAAIEEPLVREKVGLFSRGAKPKLILRRQLSRSTRSASSFHNLKSKSTLYPLRFAFPKPTGLLQKYLQPVFTMSRTLRLPLVHKRF